MGQPAARAAVPHGDDLAHDRQRGLLGGQRAEVEPDRRRDALELGLLDALGQQPLAPLGLRAARAHGADVAGVRAQRQHERGVVELRVVGEDGDRGRPVDAAELVRTPPPATRRRPPRRRGSARAARSARAGRPRTAASRRPRASVQSAAAKSTAPNTISRGGGNVTSTKQVAVALGALGPHQLVAEPRRRPRRERGRRASPSSRRRRG